MRIDMEELKSLIKNRLVFFKKGNNLSLEKFRESREYGFLCYKEHVIAPNLIKFDFKRDKKTLRVETEFGLLEDSVFNFLLGEVKYNGNVPKFDKNIKNINLSKGVLTYSEIKNTVFGEKELESTRFINCIFEHVKFTYCRFYNVNFTLSVFKGCEFDNCFFISCDFEGSFWGGNLEEIENRDGILNKVNLCYYSNCSVSTSEGIGASPFFNEEMNSRLEINNKKWIGSAIYKDMESDLKLLDKGLNCEN